MPTSPLTFLILSSHFSRCSSFAAANSLFIQTFYNHFFHYSFDNFLIPSFLGIFLSLLLLLPVLIRTLVGKLPLFVGLVLPNSSLLFILESSLLSISCLLFPYLSFPFSAMDDGVFYRPNYDLHYSPNNSMQKGSTGAAHSWENVLCMIEELQEHPRKPPKHYKIHLKRHFSAFLSTLIGMAV